MIGEAAVRLAVQFDDLAPETSQELGAVDAGDAVTGVGHDGEAPGETDQTLHGAEVILARAARLEAPSAGVPIAGLDHLTQALDLVLAQWRRAPVDHLDAVVLDRIVAARDVRPAVELPVRGGEIQDGRRHQSDVHDVDAGGPDAVHEGGAQIGRRLPVVLAHRDDAAALAEDQRRVRASDLLEHIGIDVATDAPMLVVSWAPLRENGQIVAALGVMQDASSCGGDEALPRASRMSDEFYALIAHQLRTPLTPILGWARMLMQQRPDDPVLRRAAEVI